MEVRTAIFWSQTGSSLSFQGGGGSLELAVGERMGWGKGEQDQIWGRQERSPEDQENEWKYAAAGNEACGIEGRRNL